MDTASPRTLLRRLRAKDLVVASLLAAGAVQLCLGDGAGPIRRESASQRTAAQVGSGWSMRMVADAAPQPLVDAVAPPGYAPGSTERTVFDAINEARARGNFGLLAQDTRLDAAAARHADYMAKNLGGAISHRQDPRQPGFTGETPLERVRASGYETAMGLEAISSGANAPACLELLNTVYHLGVLMIGATDVGIAVHPGAGCVIEPQLPGTQPRMQARRAGTLGVYPYPGQAGVPSAFMPATESPNPAPDLGDAVVGPPVLVDLNSEAAGGLAASAVVLSRFALTEAASGLSVPARVLGSRSAAAAPGAPIELRVDRKLASAGHVFLLPLATLKPSTTYAVEFAGSADGIAVSRRWEFTTR